MATARLSMRKTKEILRQKVVLGRSHREVRDSLAVSLGVVTGTLKRAQTAGLDWERVEAMTEAELEAALYPATGSASGDKPKPDCAYIHTELRRAGVTLELLHLEYLEAHPAGYRYTQFCEYYRQWRKNQKRSMRQVHRAGEKTFVDYAGKKPHIVDRETGECIEVELFVACLGASSFTYAEATRTQQSADFIASHMRCFEYFGGVSEVVVPDQLKSGVTKACRYEPGVQRTYEEMAGHYDTVVIPARPKKPKDKAKVEVAVQVAERWILARLRNQAFFSLDELNERIAELLEELNDRTMRAYGASRRELFERLDKPALKPLPATRFAHGEWRTARANIDYHVEVDGHWYSVPHHLVQKEVDVRVSATTVEVYVRDQRVASHLRSRRRGRHTTVAAHMPKAHQKHLEWTPTRLIEWAQSVGPMTRDLVAGILEERPHPEQGYRTCLGILRLAKTYGEERLERACARAVVLRARSYRHVQAILKNGLDRMPMPEDPAEASLADHENIRGGEYYH
jgi:transposase